MLVSDGRDIGFDSGISGHVRCLPENQVPIKRSHPFTKDCAVKIRQRLDGSSKYRVQPNQAEEVPRTRDECVSCAHGNTYVPLDLNVRMERRMLRTHEKRSDSLAFWDERKKESKSEEKHCRSQLRPCLEAEMHDATFSTEISTDVEPPSSECRMIPSIVTHLDRVSNETEGKGPKPTSESLNAPGTHFHRHTLVSRTELVNAIHSNHTGEVPWNAQPKQDTTMNCMRVEELKHRLQVLRGNNQHLYEDVVRNTCLDPPQTNSSDCGHRLHVRTGCHGEDGKQGIAETSSPCLMFNSSSATRPSTRTLESRGRNYFGPNIAFQPENKDLDKKENVSTTRTTYFVAGSADERRGRVPQAQKLSERLYTHEYDSYTSKMQHQAGTALQVTDKILHGSIHSTIGFSDEDKVDDPCVCKVNDSSRRVRVHQQFELEKQQIQEELEISNAKCAELLVALSLSEQKVTELEQRINFLERNCNELQSQHAQAIDKGGALSETSRQCKESEMQTTDEPMPIHLMIIIAHSSDGNVGSDEKPHPMPSAPGPHTRPQIYECVEEGSKENVEKDESIAETQTNSAKETPDPSHGSSIVDLQRKVKHLTLLLEHRESQAKQLQVLLKSKTKLEQSKRAVLDAQHTSNFHRQWDTSEREVQL